MKTLIILDEKTKKMYIVEKNLDSYNYDSFDSLLGLFQITIKAIRKIMNPTLDLRKDHSTEKDVEERLGDPNYEPKNAEVKTR